MVVRHADERGWPPERHPLPVSARRLLLFFGLLAVGLAAVVLITGGRGKACAF
ncbi:MAG: hypothetical protein QOE84_1984, partial [Actinomycetota bacterium]|nr:hypothetical protein [Actinomycetota bacterium]MDT7549590.1 hypothetical protein [Actinomycetota bacterium]